MGNLIDLLQSLTIIGILFLYQTKERKKRNP